MSSTRDRRPRRSSPPRKATARKQRSQRRHKRQAAFHSSLARTRYLAGLTHQSSTPQLAASAEAGRQVAQLRHVLGLVEQIAGKESGSHGDAGLDENARVSSAYEAAPPIVRRRFDALAEEAVAWATAGVQALVAAKGDPMPPRAAAAGLADELSAVLRKLGRLIPD
jgi:hypothetical protein